MQTALFLLLLVVKRCIKKKSVVACFMARSRRRRGGCRGVEQSAALRGLGSPLRHELLLVLRFHPGAALPHVRFADTRGVLHQALAPTRAVLRTRGRERDTVSSAKARGEPSACKSPKYSFEYTTVGHLFGAGDARLPNPRPHTPMIAYPLERPCRYE